MISTLATKLTSQFYEWEILGRGWIHGSTPIDLEPPFTPFFGHFISNQVNTDDGLHHTLFSKAASLFKKKMSLDSTVLNNEVSYDLFEFENEDALARLRIIIPKKLQVRNTETEQFLTMLSFCTMPMGFELIANDEKIFVQICCRASWVGYIKGQAHTYFSDVSILENDDDIADFFADGDALMTVDFGLKEEFMRPMAQGKSDGDSFTGIFSILENLEKGEKAIFQVLFNGVVNPWPQSILYSVSNGKKGAFFEDAPEMLPMAKEKINTSLFAVTIRVLTAANSLNDAQLLLQKLSFAITTASKSSGNSLVPLSNEEYTFEQRLEDIFFAESHRLGMLLNVKELATFVHLPTINSKKLLSDSRKTKASPFITEGHSFTLGTNEHNGISKALTLHSEQRLKHTHIIGATGTGKSTLLLNMILQDVALDNGFAVLDPHGDLIENVLKIIPEKRINDVVIIDPSDVDFPLSFNILQAHSEIEKEILSSDLVAAFKRLSSSWGDQMNSVLANAILAFLESSKGGTLIDLRRFLIEKSFRNEFLKTVADPNIQYYWQREYDLLKTNSIGPILTRLDSFLRSRIIRNMVAQKKGIDFEHLLNTQKIVLIKLSQGLIGNENSFMLGTFILSKIHQAAFARQAKEERKKFFVYVDEFQNFITPSMASILSGARKYQVGLILAHQDLQQLQKYDSELSNSVISNAGTRICFRVGDTDAKRLADGFSFFEPEDLQNLNVGEAVARVEKSENDFSLNTSPTQVSMNDETIVKRIYALSRDKYCTPKDVVESILFRDLDFSKDRENKKMVSSLSQKNHSSPSKEPVVFNESVVVDISEDDKNIEEDKTIERVIKKKEDTQHRYLQNLIKRMAEARGYKATLEAAIPPGKEKVDVLLEKNKETIACEISITTDATWEMHNIQKCLNAGYNTIVSCQIDNKAIRQFQTKAKEIFSKEELDKIKFFTPESLFNYLDEMAMASMETETTMKGYRVKVSYDAITLDEMNKKRNTVAKVVSDSLKKLKQ